MKMLYIGATTEIVAILPDYVSGEFHLVRSLSSNLCFYCPKCKLIPLTLLLEALV
jgi:hypothetical protein